MHTFKFVVVFQIFTLNLNKINYISLRENCFVKEVRCYDFSLVNKL